MIQKKNKIIKCTKNFFKKSFLKNYTITFQSRGPIIPRAIFIVQYGNGSKLLSSL